MTPLTQGMAIYLLLIFLASCGSLVEKKAQKNQSQAADANIEPVQKNPCANTRLLENEKSASTFRFIPVNQLKALTQHGELKSLCEIMLETGKEVVVFQLAGVACLSCQDEAEYLEHVLKDDPRIGHAVVFTDFQEDYSEDRFQNFIQSLSPHAIRLHDQKINLWKNFSLDPSSPSRPTLFAVNIYGHGHLINEEGSDFRPILNYAKSLLVASADQTSKPPIDDDVDRGKGDDDNDDRDEGGDEGIDNDDDDDGLKPLSLTTAQNLDLRNADGESIKLADIFKSEYLIIDVSVYDCYYCRKLAESHQADTQFQNLFATSKCKLATIIPDNDQSRWYAKFPKNSFVGQTTFGIEGAVVNVGTVFGRYISGTPTVLVIDREGKVVTSQTGGVPSQVTNLCQAEGE